MKNIIILFYLHFIEETTQDRCKNPHGINVMVVIIFLIGMVFACMQPPCIKSTIIR